MKPGKYVVVQRTGFVPYFLAAWYDGTEQWDCLRARALTFDGPTARRIASKINAKNPAAPLPVLVEAIR